ncbi:MAG: U32 family peptidase [Victivallaceae bacterium]
MIKPVIMAPAGSFESLSAALRSGADAVYFGVGTLNMRSGAAVNFTESDLTKVMRLCRAAGVKAYLTLNIIIYDNELAQVESLLDAAASAGVDAVIASDLAVILAARRRGIPVHLSVQANVSNLESLCFYAQYCDVVVPARELSLSAIKHFINSIAAEKINGPGGEPVKIELFAHGALCVAVSGKCYMSLTKYNASANRGACLQNCRRRYRVIDLDDGNAMDLENGYVMSPADLCMIRFIPELMSAGVSVLKLEGRGRSADYVAVVTQAYRRAVDAVASGTFTPELAGQLEAQLNTVFNRGFWHGGYYLGEEFGEWSGAGGNHSPVQKIHAGKVTRYFSRAGIAELTLEAQGVKVGDRLLITGPTTGALEVTVESMRFNDAEAASAPKGGIITIPVDRKVRINDKVFLVTERRFGEPLRN